MSGERPKGPETEAGRAGDAMGRGCVVCGGLVVKGAAEGAGDAVRGCVGGEEWKRGRGEKGKGRMRRRSKS